MYFFSIGVLFYHINKDKKVKSTIVLNRHPNVTKEKSMSKPPCGSVLAEKLGNVAIFVELILHGGPRASNLISVL